MAKASDIFDALMADHAKHRALLARIAETERGSPTRKSLFEEFTFEAKGPCAAEEQAFYSTIMRKPDTTDKARHSVSEHKEIEDMLNALAATEIASDDWQTRFHALKDEYLHHIGEEEEEVFPAASQVLTVEDEQYMRTVFERRKAIEKDKAEITPEKEPRH